jgi:hypothetical protein
MTCSLIVLTCSLLCGCAALGDIAYSAAFRTTIEDASKLSTDEFRQLQQIQLYTSGAGLAYTSTGQVKGISCKLSAGLAWRWRPALSEPNGKTPEEAAMVQLKIKALRAGGNAIASPVCSHNEGLDWANNCFESWICVGEAIRTQ